MSSLERRLEVQLDDYNVLVEKIAKAKVYAEMIDEYVLDKLWWLTVEEGLALRWLGQSINNSELIQK